MRNLEQRITVIEGMVAEIHAALVQGRVPPPPGIEEYRRAVEAMTDGDMEPLRLYLKRGGKVPDARTAFPESGRFVRRRTTKANQ